MASKTTKAGRSHPRTFLLVVDKSPEFRVALRYACLRAKRLGGRIALLYAVEDPQEQTEWLSVGNLMRDELREEAETELAQIAKTVEALSGNTPVLHVREGEVGDELNKLLDEDRTFSILVLGAAAGPGGPGPVVTGLFGKYKDKLRVPVIIVPGTLTDAEIDEIT